MVSSRAWERSRVLAECSNGSAEHARRAEHRRGVRGSSGLSRIGGPLTVRAPPLLRAQPDWYSKDQRGGTHHEALALALLVARWRGGDDVGVRKWCDAVIADAPA